MIDNLLEACFREKKRVPVPKRGILVSVDVEDSRLHTAAFVFNPSVDCSELTAYVKDFLRTDAEHARLVVEGYSAWMDSVLARDGEYPLGELGTLRLDGRGAAYMINSLPAGEPAVPEPISEEAGEEIADRIETARELNDLIEDMAAENKEEDAIDHIKQAVEEQECRERLSEIFTSKRCFNDRAGERPTLQTVLGQQENRHFYSEKIETLYKDGVPEEAEIKVTETVVEQVPAPKKRKKRLDTVWIVFIIAVLGLIGVGVYYFQVKKNLDAQLPAETLLEEVIPVEE